MEDYLLLWAIHLAIRPNLKKLTSQILLKYCVLKRFISIYFILIMGITRLGDFLKKTYPHVIKGMRPHALKKGVYAIDASSTMYSFLAKTITFSSTHVSMPTDSSGNMTGHLIGLLYRGLLCKELGLNTVWVFDGKPPRQKSNELLRRREVKEQASLKEDEAREAGNLEQTAKQAKRTIYISKSQREDAKKLIQFMGMPVIQANCEAEAQCAWLVKNQLAEGVIGQDIDTIVFGANKLVKNFSRDNECKVIEKKDVLQALQLTQKEFIDFCILCGCDYTAKIAGIGPVKALAMIKQNKNIEGVIEKIYNDDKLRKRHSIPEDFNHLIARNLFQAPNITQITPDQVIQRQVQQNDLRWFLIQKEFNDTRIENWITKAKKFEQPKRV